MLRLRPHLRISLIVASLASGCSDDGSSSGGPGLSTHTEGTQDDGSQTAAAGPNSTGDAGGGSDDGATGSAQTGAPATSSTTASSDTTGDDDDDGTSTGGATGEPVVVAVGYGGLRVRSLDGGQSWQDETRLTNNGGDDMALLRGAAWGEGRFVAVGWRIFSSPDGDEWTEHDNPTGQWYGSVAYGNDMFLAVGGGGYCAHSDDGENWESCPDVTPGGGFVHVRSTVFADGLFYTADGNGVLRSSSDGITWTVEDAGFGSPWAAVVDGSIVPQDQNAPAELSVGRFRNGQGQIYRADVGSGDFASVYDIPGGNNVFQAYRFAFTVGSYLESEVRSRFGAELHREGKARRRRVSGIRN